MNRVAAIGAVVCCLALAGCASGRIGSVVGGECRAIPAPTHVIKGKTKHDQAYVDDVTESGVAACGWERPKPRPKSWDAAPRRRVAPATVSDPVPPPKRRWYQRFRSS